MRGQVLYLEYVVPELGRSGISYGSMYISSASSFTFVFGAIRRVETDFVFYTPVDIPDKL